MWMEGLSGRISLIPMHGSHCMLECRQVVPSSRESEHWVFPCWQKARKGGGMGEHGGKGSVQEWKGKLGSPFPSGPKFFGSAQCGMGWLSVPRGGSIIIPWLGKTRNQQTVDEEHFVALSGYPNRALQIQGFSPKYIQVAQARALQKSCLPSQQCPEHSFSPLKSEAYARWHGSHTDFLLLIRPGLRSLNNIPSLKILHQDPALSIQVSLPLLYLLNKYFSESGSVVED